MLATLTPRKSPTQNERLRYSEEPDPGVVGHLSSPTAFPPEFIRAAFVAALRLDPLSESARRNLGASEARLEISHSISPSLWDQANDRYLDPDDRKQGRGRLALYKEKKPIRVASGDGHRPPSGGIAGEEPVVPLPGSGPRQPDIRRARATDRRAPGRRRRPGSRSLGEEGQLRGPARFEEASPEAAGCEGHLAGGQRGGFVARPLTAPARCRPGGVRRPRPAPARRRRPGDAARGVRPWYAAALAPGGHAPRRDRRSG